MRIDAESGDVKDTIPVGEGPSAIVATDDAMWVTNELSGTISRINPATDRVVATIRVGTRPAGIASADGALYVAVRAGGAAHRGGTLTALWALASRNQTVPQALDPRGGLTTISGMVYDALVGYQRVGGSEGSQLVPDLAESLPAPAAAGKAYTFRVRKVPYSTGALVRPIDFRYGLESTLRGPGSAYLAEIVGAKACQAHKGCDLSRGVVVGQQCANGHFPSHGGRPGLHLQDHRLGASSRDIDETVFTLASDAGDRSVHDRGEPRWSRNP
jgi:YVTN family beta-propeller protein